MTGRREIYSTSALANGLKVNKGADVSSILKYIQASADANAAD